MRQTRRKFLCGLGGTCMALPFLEIFARSARSAGGAKSNPSRYVFMFGGFSIGSGDYNLIAPAALGPWDESLPLALEPLAEHGVADVVSLVSGLSIPTGNTSPAGGRTPAFHSTSHTVLSTGVRYDPDSDGEMTAESSDWVAARTLASGTPQAVLAYRAQPVYYHADYDGQADGIISARINQAGELEQVPPITSPRLAFESLFSGFIPPDAVDAQAAERLLELRRSVVDLVAQDANALLGELGREDQRRMERHFDELRALETRLQQLDLPEGAACEMFRHPGDDPPIGDSIDIEADTDDYNAMFENASGYSNEALRATVMTDLIHMAFACDISRVASFMITHANSFMNMYTPLDMPSDLHEITHGSIIDNEGDTDEDTDQSVQRALAKCAAWHLQPFARLVEKLRETPDVDGTPLLDSTALAFAFEGGWGFDAESGETSSPHSTENMCMLVAGHAGGLNQGGMGRHIDGDGRHPSAVLNTALRALGVDETLGEVPGLVDELLA